VVRRGESRHRSWCEICLCFAIHLVVAFCPASDACGEELDLRPTSSSAARREAIGAIPLAKFSAEDRRELEQIVDNASLYRRLPTKVVQCEPRLCSLFMEHPQVMVNVWEVLGISKVRMKPTGQATFEASDGNGTHGTIRILESVCDDNAQNRVVAIASGTYQAGGLAVPIHADCVALVRSGSVRDRDGKAFVTTRIDVFIRLEQIGVELVARTLHPLLVRVADRNFEQTVEFVSSFSEAAEKNPRGVARLAEQLDHVPRGVQQRLSEIAHEMSTRRTASASAPEANGRKRGGTSLAQASSGD
jgi:hypothetical protein